MTDGGGRNDTVLRHGHIRSNGTSPNGARPRIGGLHDPAPALQAGRALAAAVSLDVIRMIAGVRTQDFSLPVEMTEGAGELTKGVGGNDGGGRQAK